jgi:hypothetical protein
VKNFSCEILPAFKNGKIFCHDEFNVGTVCIGLCDMGWQLYPNKKKKCLVRKNWENTSNKNSPIKWNFSERNG